MNKEINENIRVENISAIMSMFGNSNLDYSSLQITSESDFVLGAVWASVITYFNFVFRNSNGRPPDDAEIQYALTMLFSRGGEIRKSVMRIMGV